MNYNLIYEKALMYAKNDNNISAISLFKSLLKENKNDLKLIYNIARLYYEMLIFDESITYYEKIIEIDKNNVQANFDLSSIFLLKKVYDLGFSLYEYRLLLEGYKFPVKMHYPSNLEQLKDKRVLIFFEQGFGDSIQFIRFVKYLVQYTKNIHVYIQQPLYKLLKISFSSIDFVLDINKENEYDYKIPLLSLPYILDKQSHFCRDNYLVLKNKDKKNFITKNFITKNKINIGICWSGESKNSRDIYRSIDFKLICNFIESFDKNKFAFFSLQKETEESFYLLNDLSEQFDDFYTTSLLIDSMDSVISVDTSILHLAGALGKKTFALIPYLPDWRWGIKSKKNSWYSNVKLIRQTKKQEWKSVLFELKYNLAQHYNTNEAIDFSKDFNYCLNLSNDLKLEEALFYYKKLVKLYPNYAEILLGYGIVLHKLKKYKKAEIYLLEAIKLKKTLFEGYYNLGNLYRDISKYNKAIFMYKNALLYKKDFVEAINNVANCYQMMSNFNLAKSHYEDALKINSNNTTVCENYASVLKDLKLYEQSKFYYQKAIRLSPNNITVHYNYGLLLVLIGEFEKGFEEYEWRHKREDFIHYFSKFKNPIWHNQDITGKTLLIVTEQGMGDSIQFIRYVHKIKEHYNVNIVVSTVKPLIKLFKSVDAIDKVYDINKEIPFYDFYIPIMSLANKFKTTINTIPTHNNIFKINSNKYDDIKNDKKFKIGFVWSGSKSHKSNDNRDIQLNDFDILFKNKQCTFYSLQVGDENSALNNSKFKRIKNLGKEFKNFNDTACAIQNLDLVISIDTSVAHLSASLGIKTWVILPYRTGFLWMDDIDISYWYPSMKLYRKDKDRQNLNIFKQINKDIKGLFKS